MSMFDESFVTEDCDEREEDGACPIEPDVLFIDALRDRAYWLVGLLALQSMSGFILARNEALLQTHPVIIYFLTMLVGGGGTAGNQASVRGKFTLNSSLAVVLTKFDEVAFFLLLCLLNLLIYSQCYHSKSYVVLHWEI